jgi:hypothetical protein
MTEYLFLDKTSKPTDENLKDVLSNTFKYWKEIKDDISNKYGQIIPEWKFYDKKTGWTMKNMLKKRNLFFFKPYKGYFKLTFVFGDKAVSAIEKSKISDEIIQEIRSEKKYMEGRVLTVTVSTKSDLQNIFKLIEIKIMNK